MPMGTAAIAATMTQAMKPTTTATTSDRVLYDSGHGLRSAEVGSKTHHGGCDHSGHPLLL